MRTIHTLSSEVISKIAAGEVIERPAYVVKELIENAIDAGSDTIVVEIENCGKTLIRVTDNGLGMSAEDIALCFLPHTTSKLEDIDNLLSISSFGFRGEALSSIAHVSTLTIATRQKDTVGGMFLSVKEGVLDEIVPIGVPVGTTVSVYNLFSSLPARKKFLKSDKTEFRLIVEVFSRFVLSHKKIHFKLIDNKKVMFDFPYREDTFNRLEMVLGDTADNLVPLTSTDDLIKISGFIGKPNISSRNAKQFIFVNNRFVSDQIVRLAVKEAYGSLLPSSFHPVFILHINLPSERIDVNIHPRKETVSFIDQKMVFDSVKQLVLESLHEHNLTFKLAKYKNENSARSGETTSFSATLLKQAEISSDIKSVGLVSNNAEFSQLLNTYILCTLKDQIFLIDQHAAHERILYETLMQSFKKQKGKGKSYPLERPLTLALAISDILLFEEHTLVFEKIGFVFDNIPSTGIIIRSVPEVFMGRNIRKIVDDMLFEMRLGISPSSIDVKSINMLKFLACRAAVKSGDPLTVSQMKDLVKRLNVCNSNTTCPHGRPTTITLTDKEIGKWFKRT